MSSGLGPDGRPLASLVALSPGAELSHAAPHHTHCCTTVGGAVQVPFASLGMPSTLGSSRR